MSFQISATAPPIDSNMRTNRRRLSLSYFLLKRQAHTTIHSHLNETHFPHFRCVQGSGKQNPRDMPLIVRFHIPSAKNPSLGPFSIHPLYKPFPLRADAIRSTITAPGIHVPSRTVMHLELSPLTPNSDVERTISNTNRFLIGARIAQELVSRWSPKNQQRHRCTQEIIISAALVAQSGLVPFTLNSGHAQMDNSSIHHFNNVHQA